MMAPVLCALLSWPLRPDWQLSASGKKEKISQLPDGTTLMIYAPHLMSAREHYFTQTAIFSNFYPQRCVVPCQS
jgi:hypothetical protein